MPIKDKAKNKEYQESYRKSHREEFRAFNKLYVERHPEKRRESTAKYRNSHKEQCRMASSGWAKARRATTGKPYLGIKRQQLTDWVNACKDYPCFDCGGEFPPECMDFDHVKGTKVRGVAEMVTRGMAMEIVRTEMGKCELICANCHRIRTKKRHYTKGVTE
jgi:hypothetical protein